MPYINPEERDKLDELITELGLKLSDDEGKLNYAITKLCIIFLSKYGLIKYRRLNTIIGVLECAKQEFYRRIVGVYEDVKIKENGDVY